MKQTFWDLKVDRKPRRDTKTNLTSRQNIMCKNSPDRARKLFFCAKNVSRVHKSLLHTCHIYRGTHVMNFLILSGKFSDCPEIFHTVWKLFTLLKTFQTVGKPSRQSGTSLNLLFLMLMFRLYLSCMWHWVVWSNSQCIFPASIYYRQNLKLQKWML